MKNHDIGNVLRKISEALVYLLLSPLLMLHRSENHVIETKIKTCLKKSFWSINIGVIFDRFGMSKTPSGIPTDDETGPPFPVTWHRFSGSEYPQTMFIFKDKKRATWLFSRNSIICRISLKFSTVIIKVNCNEQFSNFLRKSIEYKK